MGDVFSYLMVSWRSMIYPGLSILTWDFTLPVCGKEAHKVVSKQKISKRFGTRLKLCKFTSPNETSEMQAPVSSGEYSVYFTSVPK